MAAPPVAFLQERPRGYFAAFALCLLFMVGGAFSEAADEPLPSGTANSFPVAANVRFTGRLEIIKNTLYQDADSIFECESVYDERGRSVVRGSSSSGSVAFLFDPDWGKTVSAYWKEGENRFSGDYMYQTGGPDVYTLALSPPLLMHSFRARVDPGGPRYQEIETIEWADQDESLRIIFKPEIINEGTDAAFTSAEVADFRFENGIVTKASLGTINHNDTEIHDVPFYEARFQWGEAQSFGIPDQVEIDLFREKELSGQLRFSLSGFEPLKGDDLLGKHAVRMLAGMTAMTPEIDPLRSFGIDGLVPEKPDAFSVSRNGRLDWWRYGLILVFVLLVPVFYFVFRPSSSLEGK